MVLVNAGFETYVYSRSPKPNAKADVAEGVGARYISSEQTPIEQMAEQVGNIDLIYEAAGAPQFAFEVLKHLGSNGIYVFTGVPRDQAPVEFDTERIMYNLVLKNQVVLGVVNAGPQAFDNAVRDIGVFAARWPKALRAIITGRFPMEAFHDPVMGKAGGIKNVIEISQAGNA
jgi:threonine dehydrogenase-like Zn-dependent dehydrogenase